MSMMSTAQVSGLRALEIPLLVSESHKKLNNSTWRLYMEWPGFPARPFERVDIN